MLANDRDFPEPVLHVLSEESFQARSGVVPGNDVGGLIDASATADDAKIEFVVLVPHQRLVISAKPQ